MQTKAFPDRSKTPKIITDMLTKEKFAFVHKITKEDYASIAAKQNLEQAKTLIKKSEKILSTAGA